jgi:Transposase IS4
LLIRITEQVWGSGKFLVLDSRFCVLKGLIELRKQGVFGAVFVKKRRYWPTYVKGNEIKTLFEGKQGGDADSLSGTLDGTPFHLMSMKEPDSVMTLMSTYGTCERSGKET